MMVLQKLAKLLQRGVAMIEYGMLLAFICAVAAVFLDNGNGGIGLGVDKQMDKVVRFLDGNPDEPLKTAVNYVSAKDLESFRALNNSFYNSSGWNGINGVYRNGDFPEGMNADLIKALNDLGGAWLYSSNGTELVYTSADISKLPKGTQVPAIYAQNGTNRYIVGYAYVNGEGQLATLGDFGINSYTISTGVVYNNVQNKPAAFNEKSGTIGFTEAAARYEQIVKEYNESNATSFNRTQEELNMYDPHKYMAAP